jgi:hypothetical protein
VSVPNRELQVGEEAEIRIKALRQGSYTVTITAIPERGDEDRASIQVTAKGREEEVECTRLDEAPGVVTGLRISGEWGNASIIVENIAEAVGQAVATGTLSAEGVLLKIEEPRELGIVYMLVQNIVNIVGQGSGEPPRIELDISFGSNYPDKALLKRLISPIPAGVVCRARIRR